MEGNGCRNVLSDKESWGEGEPGMEVKANDGARIHQGAPSQSVCGLVAVLTGKKLV